MGATAGSAGLGLAGAYVSGENAKNMATYNRKIADANASMLEQQAERQYKIGEEQSNNQRRQTKKLVGSQRAALAAQGVDVNDGSALEIQTETEILGAEDADRIQTNAYLEALGMKSQATQMRQQAEFGEQSAKQQATNSLITAGIAGASKFNFSGMGSAKTSPTKGTSAGRSNRDVSNLA